jgi:hypothetical protein
MSRTTARRSSPSYSTVTAAADGNGLLAGCNFVPEASYFSVRLVEMRLAEGEKYFTEFLPLGVCVGGAAFGAGTRGVE